MTVVGADGVHVQPQNTTSLLVCPGQRYDVVVEAKFNPTSSFRFIAKMATAMFTQDIPEDDALTVIGSILYTFDGKTLDFHCDSLTSSWMPRGVFNDFTMKPLNNTPLLSPPDRTINLRTNQTYYQSIGTRVGIGRQPWTLAQVPSLFTALSTGDAAFNESTYGPGVDPYIVESGEIVQIYMENPQPWPHPMHLHGRSYLTPEHSEQGKCNVDSM
jgi:iron transport multicopper oxidase